MATYAIGDVQGCFQTLQNLLDVLAFDSHRDRIYFLGDLVNRGPDSLGVLRWAWEHQDVVDAVLGNHDLHLLAVAEGIRPQGVAKRPGHGLTEVLNASDCDRLLQWLSARPFCVARSSRLMVHAGLLPRWSLQNALDEGRFLASCLKESRAQFLSQVYDEPRQGDDVHARVHASVAAMTRLRAFDGDGRLSPYVGPLDSLPAGAVPWFRHADRRSQDVSILCGHWAALGVHQEKGVYALDGGCVWGGHLAALRLEDGHLTTVPSAERSLRAPAPR